MPSFGITLPVRNRKALTTAILQQLTAQIARVKSDTPVDIHVVVVDDASTDGTPEAIEQDFPQVHLIRGDGNLWWTGAIAQGMDYIAQTLKTDYIVWLNDDITLADDFIVQLIQYGQLQYGQQSAQKTQQKRLTGGIVRAHQHPDWIVFGGVIAGQLINDTAQFKSETVLDVDTLNGNIAILPTRIVADIGLPDTQRFRHYGGDFEYICRAKRQGYSAHLSSELQATTDYQPRDVIRYMPLWIQWVTSPTWQGKWQVLASLTNRRSPYNVEHMVNSIYRDHSSVPSWRYGVFYCRKLIKIIGSSLLPPSVQQSRIQTYFQRQNVPAEIAQVVLSQS